jgi:hypothetical protein
MKNMKEECIKDRVTQTVVNGLWVWLLNMICLSTLAMSHHSFKQQLNPRNIWAWKLSRGASTIYNGLKCSLCIKVQTSLRARCLALVTQLWDLFEVSFSKRNKILHSPELALLHKVDHTCTNQFLEFKWNQDEWPQLHSRISYHGLGRKDALS